MKTKVAQPDFKKRGGLIVAVVQDCDTKQVLMQAYMNKKAWKEMLATKKLVLWSTSKNKLWRKGETSGNSMDVKGLYLDCDRDAVLVVVKVNGDRLACHLRKVSCFHNRVRFSA